MLRDPRRRPSALRQRRPRRLTAGVAVVMAALLAVALAAPGARALPAGRAPAPAAEQDCPAPLAAPALTLNTTDLYYARQNQFLVFGTTRTVLVPPVNWRMNPIRNRDWRADLQKLRFLKPLLASWSQDHTQVEDLKIALSLGLDWIEANPVGGATTSSEAWSNKVVGDRVPYLAYLGRAAECEGLLSASDDTVVQDSMQDHANSLSDPANHPSDNHGLFVDIGLLTLSQLYPFLGPAAGWRRLAHDRFLATLEGRLSADGVWLEHSTQYQFYVITAVANFLNLYGPDAELTGLYKLMRAAARWFLEPDGTPSQFGDTDLFVPPHWATTALASADGMKVFPDAGFAFVNVLGAGGERGYLAVTAGFHNLTHKHADDTDFELYDRGMHVVTDTGSYEKQAGPARDFVASSRAHSVLTVDGRSLPITDPTAPYGSGLRAWGSGDGWYAIQAADPLLARQGATETRTYLYRPNEALIVVDDVQADAAHDYVRYVQLAPGVTATPTTSGYDLAPFGGRLTDVGSASTFSAVRGSTDPLAGLTSPSFRTWVPRTTVSMAGTGSSQVTATTITLAAGAVRATSASDVAGGLVVTLSGGGIPDRTLRIDRQDQTLTVTSSGRVH